jgi:hypothetical protein
MHLTVTASDLSGATDLPDLAAAIEGAKLFCGVDTAAMHLADAVKTPSVALLVLPTRTTGARHTPSVVLRAQTPHPLPRGRREVPCREITVESVIEAVQKLLNEGRVQATLDPAAGERQLLLASADGHHALFDYEARIAIPHRAVASTRGFTPLPPCVASQARQNFGSRRSIVNSAASAFPPSTVTSSKSRIEKLSARAMPAL